MREPAEENITTLRSALSALRKSGGNAGNSIIIANLAEALMMAGDLAAAEAALDDAFAFAEQSGERYWLADLHRLKGQLALRLPEPDRLRAEACFIQAIDTAREQEARLLQLRAAVDLAELWRGARPDGDLRGLLEPVLTTIEGGETARDVRNARALLAQLDA
jgi:predicted ATPase